MKPVALSLFLFLFIAVSVAQTSPLVAGPMIGQVELRTARIWVEVIPGASVQLRYWKKGVPASAKSLMKTSDRNAWFAPIVFELVALDVNTQYEFQFSGIGGVQANKTDGSFRTKDLWQYRKPAPDFTFLTGSCHYTNEPVYDRPGEPYGKRDTIILGTMAKEEAAFMLWLGDNWYTREVDYHSEWGLWYRAHHTRINKVLQPLMKAMPHYAIWDDHDYGPNDSDKSFHLKETSRKVFSEYWANPSYGENGQGVYTKFNYADVDFFLMDDRWFRSSDNMEATIDGKANPAKRMWGEQQMEWLKNALLTSRTPFKIIVTGSQTLNEASRYNCLQDYPIEFEELMAFIAREKIGGIVFLTGDRHHSEVIKYDRAGTYPLYDITSSPLTSGIGRVGGTEKENPARVPGTLVEDYNFSRVRVTGKQGDRVLAVEFIGIQGQVLGKFSVKETELRTR